MIKKQSPRFELKTMSEEDLQNVLDWAEEENWNPGIYDHISFHKADPNGFFIGELFGRPIGCISAVRYSETYGFIGMFIVEENFRKQWFGAYLARTALAYLGSRNTGLDGLPERIDSYKSIGFSPAYKILRFEGNGKGNVTKDISDISEVPFLDLLKYDTKMFSSERADFLRSWISQPESSAFCIYTDNKIRGYGMIRKCRSGFKIGPLFADTEETADKLFVALSSCAPNEPIYIDIPEVNKLALLLAKRQKMQVISETIRMYSKKQPDFPVKNVYGITSVELG
jgi:GNAT superfamily N-acetyltransferase